MAVPRVFVTYTIRDRKNKKSTVIINFPENADIAVVKEFVSTTATMIDALIKGQISDAGVGISVELPAGIKAFPNADADVEEGARLQFRTAIGSITGFRLPTFDEAFLASGTNVVDYTAAPVGTFVARIIAGLTSGLTNVSPSDERGEDITDNESGRESFTKTRL